MDPVNAARKSVSRMDVARRIVNGYLQELPRKSARQMAGDRRRRRESIRVLEFAPKPKPRVDWVEKARTQIAQYVQWWPMAVG